METKNKISGLFIGVIVLFSIGVLWFFSGVSYRNQEKTLRNQFQAEMSANKVDYDKMWKTITQTAQVPKQYSEDFKNAYSSILSSGGPANESAVKNLFAVATGMRVPELDSSLYRKVQDVIESERATFANAQKRALAIKNEHDNLRTRFPGSLFVGNVAPLEVKLVTSERTEKAFEEGKDDNVDLFK